MCEVITVQHEGGEQLEKTADVHLPRTSNGGAELFAALALLLFIICSEDLCRQIRLRALSWLRGQS